MERYDSDYIPLPPISPRAKGGDLIFYGIDPSRPSYEAHVFVNNRDADLDTTRDLYHGYVGSFTIFGHGRCAGDEGHCDRWAGPKDEFDFRVA